MAGMITEKVPLAEIFRENDESKIEVSRDMRNMFELYGFLCIYLQGLEEELMGRLRPGDD